MHVVMKATAGTTHLGSAWLKAAPLECSSVSKCQCVYIHNLRDLQSRCAPRAENNASVSESVPTLKRFLVTGRRGGGGNDSY